MAMNWEKLKARYEAASPTTQLEITGMNLIRIQTLAEDGTEGLVAHHLVRESQFFIEWAVPQLTLETEMTLATDLGVWPRLLQNPAIG